MWLYIKICSPYSDTRWSSELQEAVLSESETLLRRLTQEEDGPAAAAEFASRLKILTDPVRLRIIAFLDEAGAEGLKVVELTEKLGSVAQATVSHHLSLLEEAGLVIREKQGPYNYAVLEPHKLIALINEVDGLLPPRRR